MTIVGIIKHKSIVCFWGITKVNHDIIPQEALYTIYSTAKPYPNTLLIEGLRTRVAYMTNGDMNCFSLF